MTGKLSPQALARLAVLAEARRKWDHLRALVEQATAVRAGTFGAARSTDQAKQEAQQRLLNQIARIAVAVEQILGEHGFKQFGADLQEMTTLARRGGRAPLATLHHMREIVGSVSGRLEIAERDVRQEDAGSTE